MSGIEHEALGALLLAAVLAVAAITWRLYRRLFRGVRRSASEFRAVLAGEHARQRAETDFLSGQARRVDCPVCGALRGEDCHRPSVLLRLMGPHPARLSAYRQAIR